MTPTGRQDFPGKIIKLIKVGRRAWGGRDAVIGSKVGGVHQMDAIGLIGCLAATVVIVLIVRRSERRRRRGLANGE
jgi:hypothetical protein